MPNAYDILYFLGLAASCPFWLVVPKKRRKVLSAFRDRGGDVPTPSGSGPVVLVHAVSVGEMNATRTMIAALRAARPNLRFIVSATTETGFARGQELYAPEKDIAVVRYPLDFSGAIKRFLDAINPTLVILMELEVWPNFLKRCQQREIPVILANARLTEPSFRNYRRGGAITRRMFNRLSLVCAQDVTYGERFIALGVPPYRVVVTGTMKFDTASAAPPPTAFARAHAIGLNIGHEPIWVCGSTGPGEEEIILRIYRRMLARYPRLRLVIVPRHPQRFDEVEQIIMDARFSCTRYSRPSIDAASSVLPPVLLVDAMGILRDFYAVASIVFVGRTLVDLGPRQHGSDMIEPAALGKPVIVGPFTDNFAEAMEKFRAAQAVLEATDEEALEQAVGVLISTPAEAAALARRAADTALRERGATERHSRVILQVLATKLAETFSNRPAVPTAIAPASEEEPRVESAPPPGPLDHFQPPPPLAPPASKTPPADIPNNAPANAQPGAATKPGKSKVVITTIGPMPPKQ